MALFTGLAEAGEIGSSELGAYLGKASNRLKLEKQAIVAEILGTEYSITRPNPLELDAEHTDSIFRFVAGENLECAFNCDPQTGVETVRNLSRVIAGRVSIEEHIHISVHQNYQKAKTEDKKSYENLLAYFEVELRDLPQAEAESIALLNEFRQIHNSAIAGNSNR